MSDADPGDADGGGAAEPTGGTSDTSKARRGRILVALMFTMALAAMDTTIVATAIPQVVGDLGGFSLFTWVFSVYLLAQTVTIPVYGKLADMYGRKPVLLIGASIFLVGSALSAASWSMVALIAFRGLQGLGAGSIGGTVNTIAGDLYDIRERGKVQGALSTVWGISAVVGPALGGVFAEYATWRWIFLINLPIGAIALTLISRNLHESVERVRHRIDYPGAMLILLAAGTLIFGLLQGGVAWPWLSGPSIAVFAIAAAFAVAAAARERKAAEPVLPPWVWKRRVLAGANAATVLMGMLVIGLGTFLPTYGQAVLGLGAVAAGLVPATMSMGWPVASALSSRIYLRVGFRNTAAIGAALCLSSGVAFTALPFAGPVWQPVLSSVLMGCGLGLLSAALVVGVQSTAGWDQRGVVTGANMFSRFLGQSIGAAIFGAVSNAVLAARLRDAPAGMRGKLPDSVDGVSRTLGDGSVLPPAAAEYLRHAMYAATHHVFLALAATAVAALLVLAATPRHFSSAGKTAGGTAPPDEDVGAAT